MLVVVEPVVLGDAERRDRGGAVRELRDLRREVRVRDEVVEPLLERQRPVEVRAAQARAGLDRGRGRDAGRAVVGARGVDDCRRRRTAVPRPGRRIRRESHPGPGGQAVLSYQRAPAFGTPFTPC